MLRRTLIALMLTAALLPLRSVAQVRAPAVFREPQPATAWELDSDGRAVALAPDGKRVAVGGADGQLTLLDVEEKTVAGKAQAHEKAITAVVFADDDTVCSASENGEIAIWKVESLEQAGKPEGRKLEGHKQAARCLAVNEQGLISGGADGVRLWNVETGQQEAELKGAVGEVLAVAPLPGRKWIVAGTSEGTLLVWRHFDDPPQVIAAHAKPIRALAASATGPRLAAAAADGKVSLWDAKRLIKTRVIDAYEGRATDVAFSADGRVLGTAGGPAAGDGENAEAEADHSSGYVALWEVPTGAALARLGGGPRRPLALAAGDREWAAVGQQSAAHLWRSPITPAAVLPGKRQVDAVSDQIEAIAGRLPPASLASLYERRAYALMQVERWREALDDYLEAARLAPTNNMHLLRAGILAEIANAPDVQIDSAKGIAKLLSGDSDNMFLAERVLKVCALSSPPVGDGDHLQTLAEESVVRSKGLAWSAYFPTTAALMHYRFKQYDKALADVAESRRRNTNPQYRPHLPEMANLAIESMCLARTGKMDEAAKSLARLETQMDEHRGSPTTAGRNMFHDWLTVELLYVEARDLLHRLQNGPPRP